MISFDLEMFTQQVGMPNIHNVENCQHFLIGGFSQVSLTKSFTNIGQGLAFLHENDTDSFSHDIIFQKNVLLKLGRAKMMVVNIAFFNS